MTDITYTQNGIWTKFIPTTDAGEVVFCEMMDKDGVAAVLNSQAKSVIAQIRKAGYTISKSKPATKKEMDEIYRELGI